MDVKWGKIKSWHAVPQAVLKMPNVWDGGSRVRASCGRYVPSPLVDDLPAEKSCESCLRIAARFQDA